MSMLDVFAWPVLIVPLFSTIAVVVLVAMVPRMIARRRGHPWANAVSVGGWLRRIKPSHLIRRVILRRITILDCVNLF